MRYFLGFLILSLFVGCGKEYDTDETHAESFLGFLSGAISWTETDAKFDREAGRANPSCPTLTSSGVSCSSEALTFQFPTIESTGLSLSGPPYPTSKQLFNSVKQNGCRYDGPAHAPQTWFEGRKISTFSGGATCSTTPTSNSSGKMVITYEGSILTMSGTNEKGEPLGLNASTLKLLHPGDAVKLAYFIEQSANPMGLFVDVPQAGHDRGITVSFEGSGATQKKRILINNAHVWIFNDEAKIQQNEVVYTPSGTVNGNAQATLVATGSFSAGNGQISVTLENGPIITEHLLGPYVTKTTIEEPLIYVKGCPWPVRGKVKAVLNGTFNGKRYKAEEWDNEGKYEIIKFDRIGDITNAGNVGSNLCGRVNFKHFSKDDDQFEEKHIYHFF